MTVRRPFGNVIELAQATHVHQMLGVVIIVAHASEIARVVTEITFWHLLIAFALFGLWLVTQKAGGKRTGIGPSSKTDYIT